MKNAYLAHITLPEEFTLELYKLIPKQRALINELRKRRIILSYSLDMERSNVWAFIAASSEHEVMDILSTFPIIKFVKVSIHELAFHETAANPMPDLIMN